MKLYSMCFLRRQGRTSSFRMWASRLRGLRPVNRTFEQIWQRRGGPMLSFEPLSIPCAKMDELSKEVQETEESRSRDGEEMNMQDEMNAKLELVLSQVRPS
ncbi:hypothetical protein PAHAL_8G190900 [Panicum hallii]|uniref:Uncharacterized protein n=1 Tax=Panicum hallii TaxID=206008 RepID=A0A2T8I9J4_9POAL|nr:hypothetical protein PAHAL_8G190900 [Panicum hallii]